MEDQKVVEEKLFFSAIEFTGKTEATGVVIAESEEDARSKLENSAKDQGIQDFKILELREITKEEMMEQQSVPEGETLQ